MKSWFLSLLMLLTAFTVRGASPAARDTAVYFINVYPGSEIYELEGHSALAFVYPDGRGVAVSYGIFDFNSPNFVGRFVSGQTDYMAAAMPLEYFLAEYAAQGRKTVAHRIDLTPAQTAALVQRVNENLLPQNRIYRYNYIYDNCATRPLRMVEEAVGDSIEFHDIGTDIPAGATFRDIMRHYHRNYPWYQFGIDAALGSEIDRPLNIRQYTFAPVLLDGMLASATVGDAPLLRESYVLIEPESDPVAGPTPWFATPMFVSVLVLALVAFVAIRDMRRRSVTRWLQAVYFGIVGLVGCLVAYLVFISVHAATSPNWLLAWLNPFGLVVPVLIYIKGAKKVLFWYQFINFAVLLMLIAFWWATGQSANPAFWPLMLAELLLGADYLYCHQTTRNIK